MHGLCHTGPPSGPPAPALTPRPPRPLVHWQTRAHPPTAAHELVAASPLPCLGHPCRLSRHQTTSSPTSHTPTPLRCHRTMDGLPAPAVIPPFARPLRYRSNRVGPDTAQIKGLPHSHRCTSVRSPSHLDVRYKGPRRHVAVAAIVHITTTVAPPEMCAPSGPKRLDGLTVGGGHVHDGAHRRGPRGSTGASLGAVRVRPACTVRALAARRARRWAR